MYKADSNFFFLQSNIDSYVCLNCGPLTPYPSHAEKPDADIFTHERVSVLSFRNPRLRQRTSIPH